MLYIISRHVFTSHIVNDCVDCLFRFTFFLSYMSQLKATFVLFSMLSSGHPAFGHSAFVFLATVKPTSEGKQCIWGNGCLNAQVRHCQMYIATAVVWGKCVPS